MLNHLRVEILAFRKGMWEKVKSRLHKPTKIFPFGQNTDEVMLYGTVDYELKDGRKTAVDWAARGHLVKEDSVVKMDFYQVYLVSLIRLVRLIRRRREHSSVPALVAEYKFSTMSEHRQFHEREGMTTTEKGLVVKAHLHWIRVEMGWAQHLFDRAETPFYIQGLIRRQVSLTVCYRTLLRRVRLNRLVVL